jgi:hypothetical protein
MPKIRIKWSGSFYASGAKRSGLVLNLKQYWDRSYMLMETNEERGLLKNLLQQHYFSVSNSLMYSIYKMLPNDTDLTV